MTRCYKQSEVGLVNVCPPPPTPRLALRFASSSQKPETARSLHSIFSASSPQPTLVITFSQLNMPLPSSKNPHFQNEARWTTFLVKISFVCMRMKNDFRIKG